MDLNNLIQPSRLSVTDIVTRLREGAYFVDDSFQRKLVWTEKQKARLIETILMNYPIPEIYIWEQGADPETGKQKYSIVDGQQRLTTLQQFISNEWALKVNYLDENNRENGYAGKFWKGISDADKKGIWEYVINVRTIPSSVSDSEIRAVFKRLNETDKSLNPQELRNAEFNGLFITAAEEVTQLPFFEKKEVFSASQIRRMGDIEFASSLLILLRKGVVTDSPKSINEIYDTYNDIYEERKNDIKEITTFFELLDSIFTKSPKLEDMFTKTNNLYSLFGSYILLKKKGINIKDKIVELVEFVVEYNKKDGTDSPLIKNYRDGVSSQTRSKTNREKRIYSLTDWLTGKRS